MNFSDAVSDVIADLSADEPAAMGAAVRGLGIAVAAWSVLADLDPAGGWDLFGLDVCAAVEAIHVGVAPAPPIDWTAGDRRSTRRDAARLVEAVAANLDDRVDTALVDQLECAAAADQLRRAAGALR